MKIRRFLPAAALTLSLAVAMSVTALANSPAKTEKRLSPYKIDVSFEPVGDPGGRFQAGSVGVLCATVSNLSGVAVSGTLSFHDPVLEYAEAVSRPVQDAADGEGHSFRIEGLEPGGSAVAAFVVRFPAEAPEGMPSSWVSSASFAPDGGKASRGHADCSYGTPGLVLDKEKLERDGVVDIRNEGDGGASKVRVRFMAKAGKQTGYGLPDCAEYVGEGRFEVLAGGIAPGGHVEMDVSGLLHDRADLSAGYELVFEGQEAAQDAG